jgi:hypothetical protein
VEVLSVHPTVLVFHDVLSREKSSDLIQLAQKQVFEKFEDGINPSRSPET